MELSTNLNSKGIKLKKKSKKIGLIIYGFKFAIDKYLELTNREKIAKCGHSTRKRDVINFFDGDGKPAKTIIKLPLNKKGEIQKCTKCIEKTFIRCGCCGKTIFPGSGLTLIQLGNKIPNHAIIVNSSVVGCMDCVPSSKLYGHLGGDGNIKLLNEPNSGQKDFICDYIK